MVRDRKAARCPPEHTRCTSSGFEHLLDGYHTRCTFAQKRLLCAHFHHIPVFLVCCVLTSAVKKEKKSLHTFTSWLTDVSTCVSLHDGSRIALLWLLLPLVTSDSVAKAASYIPAHMHALAHRGAG